MAGGGHGGHGGGGGSHQKLKTFSGKLVGLFGISLPILLIIILVLAFRSDRTDKDEQSELDQGREATASAPSEPRGIRTRGLTLTRASIEPVSTEFTDVTVPPQGDSWHVVRSRPNLTLCMGPLDGLSIEYQGMDNQWHDSLPANGLVWATRAQASDASADKTWSYRFDSSNKCDTPPQ